MEDQLIRSENEFLVSVIFVLVPGWVNDLPFHWVLKYGHMSSPTLCLLTTVSCSVSSIFPQNVWVTGPVSAKETAWVLLGGISRTCQSVENTTSG